MGIPGSFKGGRNEVIGFDVCFLTDLSRKPDDPSLLLMFRS